MLDNDIAGVDLPSIRYFLKNPIYILVDVASIANNQDFIKVKEREFVVTADIAQGRAFT